MATLRAGDVVYVSVADLHRAAATGLCVEHTAVPLDTDSSSTATFGRRRPHLIVGHDGTSMRLTPLTTRPGARRILVPQPMRRGGDPMGGWHTLTTLYVNDVTVTYDVPVASFDRVCGADLYCAPGIPRPSVAPEFLLAVRTCMAKCSNTRVERKKRQPRAT